MYGDSDDEKDNKDYNPGAVGSDKDEDEEEDDGLYVDDCGLSGAAVKVEPPEGGLSGDEGGGGGGGDSEDGDADDSEDEDEDEAEGAEENAETEMDHAGEDVLEGFWIEEDDRKKRKDAKTSCFIG